MKILGLDYDGVLVYSRKETFAVAYNSYVKLYGFKNLPNVVLGSENFNMIEGELKNAENEFNKIRPYCSTSCMFSSIMSAIDKGLKIRDEKDFKELLNLKNNYFRKKFHDERERLQKEDFKSFLKLTPPFDSVIRDVNKLGSLFDKSIIITANRKDLVQRILQAYGLEIAIEYIYDFYGRHSGKADIVRSFLNKTKPEDFVFIDDLYSHLEELSALKIKVFMADWGFESEENKYKARAKGIEVIRKEELYFKVKDYINNSFLNK